MKIHLRKLLIALGSVALFAVSGCGSDNGDSTDKGGSRFKVDPDPAVVAKVPASFRGKPLQVGTAAKLAPMEYVDEESGKIVGADVDLMNAFASKMGLSVNWNDGSFDSLIAGVASDRFSLAISAISDTKSREKIVDFVTYLHEGASFYTAAGKDDVKKFSDLCGHTVAMVRGFYYISWAQELAPKCPAGKPLNLKLFNDHNEEAIAVTSGRADVALADTPVAIWAAKNSDGKLVVSGKEFDATPFGMPLKKGSPLAPALRDAVQSVIDDGTYKKILDKWGLATGAIKQSKINGAES